MGYARANRQKPSGIAAKETILKRAPGSAARRRRRLDAITNEDVQRLKSAPSSQGQPKTVNNVLTVLNVLLKKAVEWDVIDRMPCTIRLLKIAEVRRRRSTTSTTYERLVEAARRTATATYLVVLARRGGRAAVRRDHGAARGATWTCTSVSSAWPAVRLEGPRDAAERRAAALRADDGSPRDGAAGASASAGRARALRQATGTADAEDRAGRCSAGGSAGGRRQRGRAHPAPHVLFASGDAGRAGAGDSGTGRTPGSRRRRSGTCTSARRRWRAPSGCWMTSGSGPGRWRHCGDGGNRSANCSADQRVKWWRRRELNPRPRARHRRTLHACPLLLIHGRPGEEAKTASR